MFCLYFYFLILRTTCIGTKYMTWKRNMTWQCIRKVWKLNMQGNSWGKSWPVSTSMGTLAHDEMRADLRFIMKLLIEKETRSDKAHEKYENWTRRATAGGKADPRTAVTTVVDFTALSPATWATAKIAMHLLATQKKHCYRWVRHDWKIHEIPFIIKTEMLTSSRKFNIWRFLSICWIPLVSSNYGPL